VDIHAVSFDDGNGTYRMENGQDWIYPIVSANLLTASTI